MKSLTETEINNLSQFLLSTNPNNIEIGLQILHSHPLAVDRVSNELVLISQLSWHDKLRENARSVLEQHYDTEQLQHWDASFQVFHIYHNLFDAVEFEENWEWFEKHERIRPSFMPYIIQNQEYAGEYFTIASTLTEYYRKRLDLAESYYKIPLEANANDLNAWINLANLYKDGYHDYPKALDCYNKMLSIDQQHYDALEAKGTLLLDYIKTPDAAIELFEYALTVYPNDTQLTIGLADCLMVKNEAGSYEKGKTILEDILEHTPHNTLALTIYGNRLWLIGNQIDEAKNAYLKGLEFSPRNYNILGNLAELYSSVYKDYDKAQEYYVKAFAIYMDDPFHLCNYISMLVFELGELNDAKDYYIHLQGLSFETIKREPELSDAQWITFQKAMAQLLEAFPQLS